MLFNSQEFLLLFLPLTSGAWFLIGQTRQYREWLLIIASLIFYAYWNVSLLAFLMGSIALNWTFLRLTEPLKSRAVIWIGILLNLAAIGFFKYANFLADTVALLDTYEHTRWDIILPLGISFFTFQQISCLVDRYKGTAPAYGFREYCLYVSFFPQLIAGPIVRHDEFITQLDQNPRRAGFDERFSRGLILLIIGLIKKLFIADMAAQIADPLFASAHTSTLTFAEAWLAALAFTVQIYFDFSGYSDMAIGLGLMFGLVLPTNFNAPYRATSIQEFWQRWHMTLSRFLRDYVYIPLGGNRFGVRRQMAAGFATMVLGGLWHGAGWTFVAWGVAHGSAVALSAIWRRGTFQLPKLAGWALTMLFVCAAWVLFRAETFSQASGILTSMFNMMHMSWEVTEDDLDTWPLLVGFAMAFFLPTSQKVALEWRLGSGWIGILAGILYLVLAIQSGSTEHVEFIYFQF